ncbi:MAG: molecular chaperone HtpG [Christensenellales bacterium]|uniref:Molecular chaperone HtpG n=1 Tax=Candidatus Avichristensenella intestinipullorum TaxID=2840693 RepID=A0A9D1CIM0_9FIRM|nr:molecular chaperone HtpG [Christensenellales bacterium]HIQ62915.1 molecular chaperone HtpG [Candidatus Avichristensenella intestinipullorum]
MQSTGNISIHAQNIMPIIKKWLYSDKDIFIRELVSNGCDAVTKRKLAQPDADVDYRVTVRADEKAGTLSFTDNGVGMTEEEVEKYINQVAFSGAEEFLKQYGGEGEEHKGGIIGHFGLGFYSAFMVAARVEIDTLSWQPGAQAVRWTSEDGMSYSIAPSGREQVGTTVTLTLAEEEHEFLHAHRVREVLDKYCAFLATPVYLEIAGEEKDGTKEAGKEEAADGKAEAPKPINDTHPLWLKNPSDCTEEEYRAFYTRVFHEFEPPLFWVHLNVDYPFRLQGILYFPKIKQEFGGMMEGPIKLFSGQVFVADNIKEVIPEFLTLLKGVIDCPDLPLNVSRSFLQNDGYVRKLSAYITRKVAERLTGLFNTERENYEKYWNDIHPFIKFGCMKDETFYERMKDALLLKTTDGRALTIQEYLDANREKAENKVFYASDAQIQAAAIALYREQGIDVALLDSPIDVNFVSFLEYKNHDVRYSRVDADLSGLKAESAQEEALDEGKLQAMFRDALDKPDLKVTLESLKNETLPAMVIEEEQMRRFRDMSRFYGGGFAMPSDVHLALNRRCPVIAALNGREADENTLMICRQIYDLAEMARQPLEAEAMGKFIERSHKLLALLMQ